MVSSFTRNVSGPTCSPIKMPPISRRPASARAVAIRSTISGGSRSCMVAFFQQLAQEREIVGAESFCIKPLRFILSEWFGRDWDGREWRLKDPRLCQPDEIHGVWIVRNSRGEQRICGKTRGVVRDDRH